MEAIRAGHGPRLYSTMKSVDLEAQVLILLIPMFRGSEDQACQDPDPLSQP
jgi:hypothetical protein